MAENKDSLCKVKMEGVKANEEVIEGQVAKKPYGIKKENFNWRSIQYTYISVLEDLQEKIGEHLNGKFVDLDLLWNAAHNGRICEYCGINIDIPWIDILKFFHQDCWKQYRRDGRLYPMPKYA